MYKLLLVFFVISIQGEEHSNSILALAGAIFVIPFLIFASVAGTLADRYSKQTIIHLTRLFDIITTILGALFFFFKSVVGGYFVLFLMSTHSAIFSPCKYGIIPELVKKEEISRRNGMITSATYLAIILGTFFASFITEVTNRDFFVSVLFCVFIAIIGYITSLQINKTFPQDVKKKISPLFLSTITQTLVRAKKERYLFAVIIFGAYFLFMGAYTQLNIIPFTLQSLGLSEIAGGYLFLMTAIGIGIGAFLAGRLSGREIELGFVPIAILGIAISYIGLFIFASHIFITIFILVFTGLCGGFYIVPMDTFIQVASPEKNRGQNVAAANFLSFIGVTIASFLIAFLGSLLGLSAATGFLIVGFLTLLMSIVLFVLFADQVLRLFVSYGVRWFFDVRSINNGRIKKIGPTLIVVPHLSWIDTIIVMSVLPRLIHYIFPKKYFSKHVALFYKLFCTIPIDIEHFYPMSENVLRIIQKEIGGGNSVCLMYPVNHPINNLEEWEKEIERLFGGVGMPVMPIYISRKMPSEEGWRKELRELRYSVTKVLYGKVQ